MLSSTDENINKKLQIIEISDKDLVKIKLYFALRCVYYIINNINDIFEIKQ
jgi:hypothetical protein